MAGIKAILGKLKPRRPLLGEVVSSAFTALFLCAAVDLLIPGRGAFYDISGFTNGGFLKFFVLFAAVFLVLSAVRIFIAASDRIMRLLLLASFMFYTVICMSQSDDTYFCLFACLASVPVILYALPPRPETETVRDMPNWTLTVILCVFGLYFALLYGAETVCRYMTMATPTFDFGIFSQMFHNMRESFLPVTTCERGMLLSHFQIHISPIWYLFLPFYAIFPTPITLEICQAVMLALGVIPVFLLTKKSGLGNTAKALFAALYVLYPALGGGTYYDVHENKFLAPLLILLFYLAEKDSMIPALVCGLAVCAVKEDAPVYVAVFGIYLLLSAKERNRRFTGAALLFLALAYFGAAVYILSRFGAGVMSYRYDNFMGSGQTSLFSVIINVFRDPAHTLYEISGAGGDYSKLTFALQTLLPLGLLPLITKKPERLILLIPFVLVNLMSDYQYQHDIFYQYTYGSFAFLLYMSVKNYADLSQNTRRTIAAAALCASVLLCTQTSWRRAAYVKRYCSKAADYDEVRTTLESIPEDASVSANTFLCPALSARKELYSIENHDPGYLVDYVALDLRYAANAELYLKYTADEGYTMIYFKQGWLALFQKNAEG
ncbi:MAG: DUF2079 domain-containing protein [Clostridia bacterium]|nr:DUF2079 domain-containing protein [Clostridia bacterium]